MSNFPFALNNLFEEFHITRRGWRNKFHLAAETFDGMSEIGDPGPLTIVRVNADGSKWPWTPTEDDMWANDWGSPHTEMMYLNGGPAQGDGCFAWAVYEIQSGRDVLIGEGPLRLSLGETHGGPCIDIVLPNGTRRLWRPQHQDLWGVYSPAPSAG
jgi:hypothetical protein